MTGIEYLSMKIGRAYKHLQEFDSLVVAHCQRPDPYTITEHDDVVNGRYVIRCEYALLEGDIALSLADLVYSLRSGLDQLVWQLALINNPAPSRDTMFPIHADQSPKSEELFRKKVWDCPCDAIAEIRNLQPYKRGAAYRDDPLWQLNELSNIDKHRLPAGRSHDGHFYLEPSGAYTVRHFDNGVEFSWPLSIKKAVVFKPKMPTLIFGDPIDATLPASRIPFELDRVAIAGIYNYVRNDVRPRFTRFFPQTPNP